MKYTEDRIINVPRDNMLVIILDDDEKAKGLADAGEKIKRLQKAAALRRYTEALEAYGELFYLSLKHNDPKTLEKVKEAEKELEAAAICWAHFNK